MIPYGESGRGRRVLRRRIPLRRAVDRRRRREDDTHAVAGRRLEHALRGEHVAAQVEREDVAEAPHPRLAGEVEDAVEPAEVELVLGQVEPEHVEAAGVLLLERRVVVVGEAVDADDLVALGLESASARCDPMNPAAPVTA